MHIRTIHFLLMSFENLHFLHGSNIINFDELIARCSEQPIAIFVPLKREYSVFVSVTRGWRALVVLLITMWTDTCPTWDPKVWPNCLCCQTQPKPYKDAWSRRLEYKRMEKQHTNPHIWHPIRVQSIFAPPVHLRNPRFVLSRHLHTTQTSHPMGQS